MMRSIGNNDPSALPVGGGDSDDPLPKNGGCPDPNPPLW